MGTSGESRNWRVVGAFAAGALWGSSASAALSICNAVATPASLTRPWTIVAQPRNEKGRLLASKQMDFAITFRASAMTATNTHRFGLLGSYGTGRPPQDGVVPLNQPAGAGLKITYTGQTPGSINPANGAFWSPEANRVFGTSNQLIGDFGWASVNGNYGLTLHYRYEVVIADPASYRKGGSPDPHEVAITVGLSSHDCQGLSYSMFAFERSPVLNDPVQAGCTWDLGSLRQTVALASVDRDAVAQFGSIRAAGARGQAEFSLKAAACPPNRRLRVFFSDSSNPSNRSDVLRLSPEHPRREEVGLRLYAGASTTPIGFGPSPTATTNLGHGLQYNTGTSGNLSLPFTVQYVRRQGVPVDGVQAGQIRAQATVTVDYP